MVKKSNGFHSSLNTGLEKPSLNYFEKVLLLEYKAYNT